MTTVMTLTQPRYPTGTSGYVILNFITTTNGTSQEWLSPKYRSHFIETKLPTWRRKQQPTPVLLPGQSHGTEEPGRLHTVHGVTKSQTGLSNFTFTFHSHALEKEMATHSSSLAWRIPWDRGAWWATYSSWGREESDRTERLHFHFSLSCTGEGNGNPLQYSCLENPRDGGAWWAAVMGSHRVGHDWSDSSSSKLPAMYLNSELTFSANTHTHTHDLLNTHRNNTQI